MITVVFAIGVSSSPRVVAGSAMPMAAALIGSSSTGVANAFASWNVRASSPTIITSPAKKISVGTAARYVSAIAPGLTARSDSTPPR
jgi:hypothetical protein